MKWIKLFYVNNLWSLNSIPNLLNTAFSAWQLHDRDPTLILWKAVYNNMAGDMMRKNSIARLHIFPEEEVGKVNLLMMIMKWMLRFLKT